MNKRMLVTLILSVFVLGSLFASGVKKDDNQIAPSMTADQNLDPNQRVSNATASREMWDLQFHYNVETGTGSQNNAGAETDGQYLYTTNYNTADLYKWELDGTFVETFTIAGVSEVRDLAYDGTYFYGSDAANHIWQMDFTNQTLVSTINTPGACRAIAYDEDQDAFWINNWSTDLILVDRSGNQIDVITAPPSIYSCAYDSYSPGGPYLWLFTGTIEEVCALEQYDLDGTPTGVTFDVPAALGDTGISGGLFIHSELVPSKATIGGLMQGDTNDHLFGFELCDTAPLDSPGAPTNLTVTPNATGALSAAIAWTNPSVTAGGATLTDLTEVKVYRDDALVYTLNTPTIGGAANWTDNTQPAAGMYEYSVVGVNSEGEGLPAIAESWIGEDVPAAVTDFTLANDEGNAVLNWVNPTTGLHNGAFNQAIQGYNLLRSDGVTMTVTGLTTTYTDTTIPEDNNYYYTITPYNSVGEGGAATCETMWIGTSIGVTIGDGTVTTNTIPINFYYRNSLTETIYMADELAAGGITAGALTHLIYYYDFTEVPVVPTITIWAGETSDTSLNGSWIPAGDLQQVYTGDPVWMLGENEVVIVFDTPYIYSGQNLVLMVHRPMDTEYYNSTDYFYCTDTPEFPGRTTSIQNDTTVYDPYNPPTGASTQARVPNTTLLFDTDGLGTLDGHVYDSSSNAVEDVAITLDDPALTIYTDATGYYSFPGLFEGTYNMTASKFGYGSAYANNVAIIADQNTVQDFTLPDLLNVTVTGFVEGSELPGTGLADAVVELDGYDYFETTTLADGTFSIPDVYANEVYDITVSHDGYTTYTGEITVGGADYDCGTITLMEMMLAINGLDAVVLGDDVFLTWNEPVNAMFWDFEDGVGDWVADPATAGWEWGNDANMTSHSPVNGWHTVIGAQYADGANYRLVTPEVAVPDGAQLTFWHNYDTEGYYDGGNVKISLDGGATWTLITPNGDYPEDAAHTNNVAIPGEPCYSGNGPTGWEQAVFELTDYYNTNAMFLFVWGSDGSVHGHYGWSIDDVRVGPPEERVHLGYNIYRNSASIASVGPDVLSYDDMDLADGVYTYDVTAEYTSGESDPQSVTVSVFPTEISGYVELSDFQGVGADGVLVVIQNDDLYYETTTVDGDWVISDVYGEDSDGVDYTVTMSKEGYTPYTNVITVYAADIDMGDVMLTEIITPAVGVIAIEDANQTEVNLSWGTGGGAVNEMRWDNGENDDSIGLTNGGTLLVGVRWTPDELAPYNGYPLTEIEIYINDVPSNPVLKVWTGGSWNGTTGEAGTEVVSQAMTDLVAESFQTITLDTPVIINASQELWFGYEVTHPAGEHPVGCDAGPAINYFGNLLVDGGAWASLYDLAPSLNYNWNIAGYCIGGNGEVLALGKNTPAQSTTRKSVTTKHSRYSAAGYVGSAVSPFTPQAPQTNPFANAAALERDREWINWWVYRLRVEDMTNPDNWVLLANDVQDSSYTNTGWDTQAAGTYMWAVLAEYTGSILSDPAFSNSLDAPISTSQITVTVTCNDGSTPNGAEMSWVNLDNDPLHVYTSTVPANGVVVIEAYYGDYNVTCNLTGYEDYESVGVTVLADTPMDYDIELEELTPPVVGLEWENDPHNVHLWWQDPFTVLGWSEDFEGGEIPEGWTMTTLASGDYPGWFITLDGSSTNWTIPAGDGYYACSNDDITNPSDGSVDYLITPPQDLSSCTEMQVNFDSYFGDCYSQVATFEYSTDGGTNWTIIETIAAGTSGAWDNLTINLDDYTGAGFDDVLFGFHSDDAGGWMYGWAVDNVVFGDGGEAITQLTRKGMSSRAEVATTRSLLGYHIEREMVGGSTEVVADLITDLEFFDTPPAGSYYYHVYASYTTGLSEVMSTDRIDGLDTPNAPAVTALSDNYPNPFNPETKIAFSLAENADVRIDIYNVRGQKVNTLVNEPMDSGNHTVTWKGQDDNGQPVASGIYFYKMQSGRYTATKKMILLK